MELSHEYLTENREYKDYKDFVANCKLTKPENFNFAYDIVDRYAELAPEKRALVWIDDTKLSILMLRSTARRKKVEYCTRLFHLR